VENRVCVSRNQIDDVLPLWRCRTCPVPLTGGRMDQKKILIVEDNELNMKLFHDLLEVHGY